MGGGTAEATQQLLICHHQPLTLQAFWPSINPRPVSRLMCEAYCWLTRGIVFGLVLVGEVEGEDGSWRGTLTGLEKGVMGA